MDRVFELFPRLAERPSQRRRDVRRRTVRMGAIGRALWRPTLLVLDEPSMGLAPIFVERIFRDDRRGELDKGRRSLLVET